MAKQVCRPYGALNACAPHPTRLGGVGYGMTSLRDFGQHKIRPVRDNSDRTILRGRFLPFCFPLRGVLRLKR
jgi:hypothetical protein